MAQTLSIILAQYYPDKTQLRHTLDSLLMQDTYDFELIIADDGSPEDYLGGHPRLPGGPRLYQRKTVQKQGQPGHGH